MHKQATSIWTVLQKGLSILQTLHSRVLIKQLLRSNPSFKLGNADDLDSDCIYCLCIQNRHFGGHIQGTGAVDA